jgi:hypothetical protein
VGRTRLFRNGWVLLGTSQTVAGEISVKLFLDDVRDAPDGWTLARTVDECIHYLLTGKVDELSLDHDLGEDAHGQTGMSIIEWIEEEQNLGGPIPAVIRVHSMNPVGMNRIRDAITRINERRGT